MIINAFKDKIFPRNDPSDYPVYSSENELSKSDSEEDESLKTKSLTNRFGKLINSLDEILDHDLI